MLVPYQQNQVQQSRNEAARQVARAVLYGSGFQVARSLYNSVHWKDVAWWLVNQGARRGSSLFRSSMKRFWENRDAVSRKRAVASNEEEKGYAPPAKRSKGNLKNGVSMAGGSKRSASTSSGRKVSGKKRKVFNKKQMSVRKKSRGLNKKQKKGVKRMIKNSKNSVMKVHRVFDTGAVSENSYNVANYNSFAIGTYTTLETYMSQGYSEMVSAGTDGDQSALQRVRLNYDATYREWTNYKGRHIGAAQYVFKNNDLLPIELRFYEYLCMDDTNSGVNTFYNNSVDIAHNKTGENEKAIMLYPTQFEGTFAKFWKRVKKVRVVLLAPGAEVHYTMKYARKWYSPTAHTKLSNQTYVSGVSKILYVRSQGAIVHDTTDNTLVGYAKHQYDWVSKYTVKFEMTTQQVRQDRLVENLDTIETGEAAAENDAVEEVPID